ncbi:MAG: CopG-like 1 or ribbon-helix-helix domain, 5 [Acidimicrobiaceae bacterium]|jgi:metal-responsive CopG/Arc/MetJ family transcriptional regulator|nr:CopG-like 1 or ribbon-helix-helix domain, 5 [Acidimicrobiaceae bacterium]
MDTSEVVSLRLPSAVLAELDRRAGDEMRSRSNMCAVLISEALIEPTVVMLDEEES